MSFVTCSKRIVSFAANCGADACSWGARLLADQFLSTGNILRSLTTGTAIFFGGWGPQAQS